MIVSYHFNNSKAALILVQIKEKIAIAKAQLIIMNKIKV